MLPLETFSKRSNRLPVLLISTGMFGGIAFADWLTEPYVSLGFLYLFPILLAAGFLPRLALLALGVFCAILSETFSSLDPEWRISRLIFQTLALAGCGLFVSELMRRRRLSLEAQQRLQALVETSPAAIVTVDQHGVINLANKAAAELLVPTDANVVGQPIAAFVPELRNVLEPDGGVLFRASMQCQVQRGNGETFAAEVWFSTYHEQRARKLAAIIADISEEQAPTLTSNSQKQDEIGRPSLNNRQVAVLHLLLEGLSSNEMAYRLEVTPSMVKNTLQQLYLKAGVHNRSQMVRFALEHYRDLLANHPTRTND
jgi:PAS domain S-box-containing protein